MYNVHPTMNMFYQCIIVEISQIDLNVMVSS